MLKKLCYALFITLSLTATSAHADFSEYIESLKQDVKSTWTDGRISAMVPLTIWHNRLFYDDEHLDKYNEEPWGFGLGLSRYEGKNWHGLYALAFKDSNSYVETMFGYAYLRNHAVDKNENWLLGYGYTLGVTQRHEYSYIPIPLPLPMAAVTYKNVSLNATYVPGVQNDGNVLFAWLRIDF